VKEATAWVKEHVGLLAMAVLLTVFSPIFSDILPNPNVSNWSKGLLLGGNIILGIIALSGDLRRLSTQRKLSASRLAWEGEQQRTLARFRIRGGLLQRVSVEVREALTEVREAFCEMDMRSDPPQSLLIRQRGVKASLKGLCKLLESDVRPDPDPLKAISFKATFFEHATVADRQKLVRKYWHYPDTIQPRTFEWDVLTDYNSGAVQAYLSRREVVMGSVAEAAKEGETWKDSRPGQHEEYAQSSMVCVPFWSEAVKSRPTADAPPTAIITIDTNQIGYFGDSEDERAFRNQIFGPFLGLMRLIYCLTEPESKQLALPEVQQSIDTVANPRELT
jgi:hypothetical protein